LFVVSTKAKVELPVLSRSTEWTAERIARLNMTEVKQLKDNALRLGEPEVAALCDQAMTALRRAATEARKAAPRKPPVKKKVVPQE
jgi:hypothetical protein